MNQRMRLKPLFHPGRLLITPTTLASLRANGIPVISVALRHVTGDWGIVSGEDREQNDISINVGLRLLSIYRLPDGEKVWVITEWDRSQTTIQLADDTPVRHAPARQAGVRNWRPLPSLPGNSQWPC
ncbi:hypothetical protein [Paraburkholderia sediminicola]|uniref:hypothetical protein n=1 Tax=Paraburkholderia sediminicola TaxID=458836 RepID=UPI0038BCB1C4